MANPIPNIYQKGGIKMTAKLKNIGNILSTVLLVIVLLFAVVITIMSYNAKLNDNIPSIFGYSTFSIQTDSMEGTINPGDLIIGEKCDPTELKEGDIISFHTVDDDGNYFINTHRIIKVNDSDFLSFQTQGDNEDSPDSRLVAPGDIISVYTGVRLPLLGYIITFLSSQLGFFICIVFPVLLYTIWQVYKLIKILMENQKAKTLEEAGQIPTSDEVKQAIINEYLAKQKEDEKQKIIEEYLAKQKEEEKNKDTAE